MDVPIVVALVGGCAATLAPALSYYLTKRNERAVTHHSLKLSHYQEFVDALACNAHGEATDEEKLRYTQATNTMHLIASNSVIQALHRYSELVFGPARSIEIHDRLLSRLVWEIRKDLKDVPTSRPEDFEMRLWSAGVKRSKKSESLVD